MEWIKIEDREPKKGQRVLVFPYAAWQTFDKYGWTGNNALTGLSRVTHWMPLPEPPT
jgi:hypothetical protein